MDEIRRTLGIIVVLAALLAGCVSPQARLVSPTPTSTRASVPAAPPDPDYWPTEGWRTFRRNS